MPFSNKNDFILYGVFYSTMRRFKYNFVALVAKLTNAQKVVS